MSDQFWKMVSPVGFSAVPLDKDMYTELTNNRAKQGLRIDGVPIQVCSIKKILTEFIYRDTFIKMIVR